MPPPFPLTPFVLRAHSPISRGVVSFAGSGKDSRDTQLFIPFAFLDFLGGDESPWETPIGYIIHGVSSVDMILSTQGDLDLDQPRIFEPDGYEFLAEHYPDLRYLNTCRVLSTRGNTTWELEKPLTAHDMQRVASALSPPPPDKFSARPQLREPKPPPPQIHSATPSHLPETMLDSRWVGLVAMLVLWFVCCFLERTIGMALHLLGLSANDSKDQ